MLKSLIKFTIAVLVYCAFSIYLYQPYFSQFTEVKYLLPLSVIAGAAGCYILSRRWINSFFGSFFAGALYGFSPFMLGLGSFHPTASVLAGSIPWFFLPAAFGPKGKWRFLRAPLSILPFIMIIVFFQAAERYHLFAVPIQAKVNRIDLISVLSPLVAAKRGLELLGIYHSPLMVFVTGFAMLIKARRFGTLLIVTGGAAASMCNSFFQVSPIMWASISFVCIAVIAGAGFDGFSLAGRADRKWILAGGIVMLVLAVATLLLASKYFQTFLGLGAGYARDFVLSAKMYILGSIAAGIIFFMARAEVRLTILRQVILSSCLVLDIFLNAQYIVDKIL